MTPKFIEHIHADIPKDLTPKVDEYGNVVCSVVNQVIMRQVESIDDELCKQIHDIAASNGIDEVYVLDKKNILSALEKQIPKKPVIPWDSIDQQHECPKCPHWVYKTQLYCDKCGQALDWSDAE